MFSKSPEDLAAYNPRNGFEVIVRKMVLASNSRDRHSAVAVAVFREVKESLGERIGSNWKRTVEERDKKNASKIVDIPMPKSDVN